MTHLEKIESQSVYILREAYSHFRNLAMLWSIGKDSTVLLWLARKAFFNHVPFPLVHIDTSFKIPEMIEYRLSAEVKTPMSVSSEQEAAGYERHAPNDQSERKRDKAEPDHDRGQSDHDQHIVEMAT